MSPGACAIYTKKQCRHNDFCVILQTCEIPLDKLEKMCYNYITVKGKSLIKKSEVLSYEKVFCCYWCAVCFQSAG